MIQTPNQRKNAILGKPSDKFQLDKAEKMAKIVKDLDRKFEEQKTAEEAKKLGMPYFNLQSFPIDHQILSEVTVAQAEEAGAIPFFRDKQHVKVGVVNPSNPHIASFVKVLGKKRFVADLFCISKSSYEQVLKIIKGQKVFQTEQKVVAILSDSPAALQRLKELEKMGEGASKVSATDLINILLTSAVSLRSSDIHAQPEKNYVSIRFRVDGVLQPVVNLGLAVYQVLIARVKILSHLKLNVTSVPQDGSFVVDSSGRQLEIRVSLLPSAYGEALVMRLLGEQNALDIRHLGFQELAYQRISAEVKKPNGMILTTGPTGSGKTTTLYSFLKTANEPGVKIITLENPVEYRLEGVEQIQIDEKQGLSFANSLRSVLRQDPDIIMVGEIRDYDTADTAAQAALTGHMVYSTLHTNDAAGAIPRLLHLGVKPVILAPALSAIIAQRLVRKLCERCKTEEKLDSALLSRIQTILSTIPELAKVSLPCNLKFYHSPGCSACDNIGYKGRIGIFEVFVVDDDMQKLIYSEASTVEIRNLAVKKGMTTMIQDGLLKAMASITDVAEVFRVAEE